jgi:transglutaminase-like putative cysteine protease
MRRDLTAAGLIALLLLGLLPAYARVFVDTGWLAPAIAAAVLSLTIAVVCRRLHLNGALALLLSGAALVAFLPWLLGVTARPVLPTARAFALLDDLWAVARVELAETPAPAPSLAGLVLAVTAGVWAVTHLGHELLVRFQRPGPALIPMTVLWAAPLVVPMAADRTWPQAVPFLAAVGFTLLVTATDTPEPGGEGAPVSAAGVALGAVVIVAAMLAPGLLPGYEAGPWVALGSRTEPRGYQPIVDISDRLRLPEERDVLRVQTSQRTYLRLAGLDSFDGFTWRLGDGEGSYRPDPQALYAARDVLPPEQPAATTQPLYVDVEVLELENIYVPVPYQPVEVLGPHRDEMVWSTEGGFLATWETVEGELGGEPRVGVREGVTYRVQAARPTPSYDDLDAVVVPPEILAYWTDLPREYPRLRAEAEAVYAAAGATTNVDKAFALQDWFTGSDGAFTYDLDVPALRGDDALEEFVLEDRTGYCEYFATAMAVMLRETGVPARVAVGFLPGRVTREADPDAGRELTEYTVSTADAHAWVEVLFPGEGWVTFEPTPRSDLTQVVPTVEDLTPTENLRERRTRELEERADGSSDTPTPDGPDLPAEVPPSIPQEPEATPPAADAVTGDGAGWPLRVALVVGALLGAALLWWRRSPAAAGHGSGSPSERILAAQRRLLATGNRYGVGRRPEETIREVVERWRSEHRIDSRGARFATAAQAAAFGGVVDADLATEMEELVSDLEELLRSSVERRDRLAAPVRVPATAVANSAKRLVASVGQRTASPD